MLTSNFRPESGPSRVENSFLKEGNPTNADNPLSRSFLEGKQSSQDGSLEGNFLRDADKAQLDGNSESHVSRRETLDTFLESEKSPDARLRACVDYAAQGSYFASQNPGHIGKFKSFVNELGPLPGVEKTLLIIGGQNHEQGKGHYCGLARAAHMKRAGKEVIAIDQNISVPGAGKTDIDILCRGKNGELEWHENKAVNTISCDLKFCQKIDKMSEARNQELTVEVDGRMEPIKRVVFTNSLHVSEAAIDYAHSKGIEIYNKRRYTQPV